MSSPLKADAPGKIQEPSMEEILASIRKIISEDDTKPAAKPAAAPPADEAPRGQDDIDALFSSIDDVEEPEPAAKAPSPPPSPEVLELTEDMAAGFDVNDVDFVDAEEPEPAPPPPARPRVEPPPAEAFARPAPNLLSSSTDSAISAAFGTLTHTILSNNARTLDDLVQDMLRPMLKNWLDDNLPPLVERLVRAEIERVSRGRS